MIYSNNSKFAVNRHHVVVQESFEFPIINSLGINLIWTQSKNGQPNVLVNGRYLHSPYNPDQEAEQLASIPNPESTSIVILLGIGLAYHLPHLLKYIDAYSMVVIAWEPLSVLQHDSKKYPAVCFPEHPNIHYLWGEHLSEEQIIPIIQAIRPTDFRGYHVIKLPSASRLFPETYQNAESILLHSIQQQFINQFTEWELQRLWVRNVIHNSLRIPAGLQTKSWMQTQKDVPAVICGAGPSLSHSLPEISQNRSQLLVISVDTALSSLIAFGIIPDIVVSLDSQIHNFKDFFHLQAYHSTLLVCDITVYWKIPFRHDHPTLFFKSAGDPSSGYSRLVAAIESILGMDFPFLASGGSVACSALDLARQLGCSPIFLTGMDLAYTHHQTHACESPSYQRMIYQSTRFQALSHQMSRVIQKRAKTYPKPMGDNGLREPIVSEPFLYSIKEWFIGYKSRYGDMDLRNHTPNGFEMEGIPQVATFSLPQTAIKPTRNLMNGLIPQRTDSDKIAWFQRLQATLIDPLLKLHQESKQWHDSIGDEELETLRHSNSFLKAMTDKDFLFYKRKQDKQTYLQLLQVSLNRLMKWVEYVSKEVVVLK